MKIKSLQLKNFKRFTDLTLTNIPDNTKLVLLIGSNGSGKSSLFDALEVLNLHRLTTFADSRSPYYSKNKHPFRVIADFGDGFILDTENKVFKSGAKIPLLTYY